MMPTDRFWLISTLVTGLVVSATTLSASRATGATIDLTPIVGQAVKDPNSSGEVYKADINLKNAGDTTAVNVPFKYSVLLGTHVVCSGNQTWFQVVGGQTVTVARFSVTCPPKKCLSGGILETYRLKVEVDFAGDNNTANDKVDVLRNFPRGGTPSCG